jgi:hypothetical protein
MPSNSLNVPHFPQELDSSCVAACVRMVLAHYGDVRSEADLRMLLDTQPTGTRAGNVMRLSGSAFEVFFYDSRPFCFPFSATPDAFVFLSPNGQAIFPGIAA